MEFKQLAELFQEIEETSSRNDMSEILANFLKKCTVREIQMISYIVQGRVAPLFVNAEFNYSKKSLVKLLKDIVVNNKVNIDIDEEMRKVGDIGSVTENVVLEIKQDTQKCSIEEVYSTLWDIVNTSGTGSISKKNKIVTECLKKLSSVESKFFTRTICGELRLGLNVRTLLDVFSITLVGDKTLKKDIERAYGVTTDIGYIAKICFEDDKYLKKLENIKILPGTPVLSRLVERVGDFEEVFKRLEGDIYVQPKFDGLRCQIHKWSPKNVDSKSSLIWHEYYKKTSEDNGNLFESKVEDIEVKLFTRNLEDVTEMFPEIVESARNLKTESFILDSEIVGWNYEKDTFLSYQETMQRRRKYSVSQTQESVPVRAMVFDLLYLKGESLVSKDTKERIELLEKEFKDTRGSMVKAETKVVSDVKTLEESFNKSVAKGLEGIIVKQFEGGYKPGFRNFEWIKLKKSMNKELVDTIDMVVVGYYTGSGRRADFGVGAVLGAIYNKEKNTFDAISKVGTGMDDNLLKQMYSQLEPITLKEKSKIVRCSEILKPDVWVEPQYVMTVEADEITRNITKTGDSIGAGLSLRFPRLIEFGRDKNPEDATTVKELLEMFTISRN